MASRIEENNSNYPPSSFAQVASSGVVEVVVLPAPGAGKQLRVTTFSVLSQNDAAQIVTFRNGISGATFYAMAVAIGSVTPQYVDTGFDKGGKLLGVNQALMAALAEASQTDVRIAAGAEILELTP